ncbi:MAG: ferredoxin-type protein NapF [Mesorhizobium sp. SCN 65-20]|nr:MAG: ferredoxin-type protein NapF [Mesorhizobium sp. SCN 65-20]
MAAAAITRRSFLTGREARSTTIAPPGVRGGWLAACTGCGACVEACPTSIIGLVEARPALDFSTGECLFCGECASVCPEPVFDPVAARTFCHVVAISDACLTHSGVACMTCRDACPEAAIVFRPRIGGPFVPELKASACTGCGACIAPCPAGAIAVSQPTGEAVHA